MALYHNLKWYSWPGYKAPFLLEYSTKQGCHHFHVRAALLLKVHYEINIILVIFDYVYCKHIHSS
jgi:hypothetical protein